MESNSKVLNKNFTPNVLGVWERFLIIYFQFDIFSNGLDFLYFRNTRNRSSTWNNIDPHFVVSKILSSS